MYKYQECYDISSKIISCYEELLKLIKTYQCKSEIYLSLIDRISRLILEEYNIYSEISKDNVAEILTKVNEQTLKSKNKVYDRMQIKLLSRQDVLHNRYLKGSDISGELLPKSIKFGICDIVSSTLKVVAHKNTKEKLDKLKIENNQDELFLEALYQQFNLSYVTNLISFSTSELIGINTKLDIDKIPELNLEIMKKDEYLQIYNQVLYVFGVEAIFVLSEMSNINNNPRSVYDYFYKLTQFETILSYVDKAMLTKLLDYCQNLQYKNKAVKESIKTLIYKKKKDYSNEN